MKFPILVFFLLLPFALADSDCQDLDHDGYGSGEGCMLKEADCNDYNARINPAASEICNNKDDDCNGIVDDIDGLTSIESTRCRCSASRLAIQELCDGIDNDCDGRIDEDFEHQCAFSDKVIPPPVSGYNPKRVQNTGNIVLGIVAIIFLTGSLIYIIYSAATPDNPEVLATYYHKKGQQAYELGNYSKAKHYYEKASDIRRRNI